MRLYISAFSVLSSFPVTATCLDREPLDSRPSWRAQTTHERRDGPISASMRHVSLPLSLLLALRSLLAAASSRFTLRSLVLDCSEYVHEMSYSISSSTLSRRSTVPGSPTLCSGTVTRVGLRVSGYSSCAFSSLPQIQCACLSIPAQASFAPSACPSLICGLTSSMGWSARWG